MEDIKSQVGGYTSDHEHGFEATDIDPRGVLAFLAVLVFSAIVIHLFVYGFYRGLDLLAQKRDKMYVEQNMGHMNHPMVGVAGAGAETPSMKAETTEETASRIVATFPSPRLQTDDVYDMSVLHGRENLYLNHYSWIDRSQGAVRIPVERAMELIAQRGLPNVGNAPQAALSPTATQQMQGSTPANPASVNPANRGPANRAPKAKAAKQK